MLKNVSDITNDGKLTGLNTQDNILGIDKSQSPDMMNVIVHFDGSLEKRLGSNTQNTVIIANSAAAGFSPTGGITNNLIAFWKLDEASGNRADAFGGHTLTDVNGVLQSGGIKNQAALFVAANTQYLIHQNTSTLATGDVDFSMSSWIYLNSTSQTLQRSIIAKRDFNSIDSFTKLLLHMNGADASTTFTDSSLTPKTVTPTAAEIDTAQSKFGGASGLFSATNSKLTIPFDNDFSPGTGDFTIDFWVRFNATDNNDDLFRDINGNIRIVQDHPNTDLSFIAGGVTQTVNWAPSTATWYHLAFVRSGSSMFTFIDGVDQGIPTTNTANVQVDSNILIGNDNGNTNFFDGWMDELRFSKGIARWTVNFTPPAGEYGSGDTAVSEYEYWLFVDTDNVPTFRVSSSGTLQNGSVRADSFGALGTATWYNVVAWHDTGNFIGISVNLAFNSAAYASGVRSGSAPFVLGAVSNGAGGFFDGRIDETGFWKKVLTVSDRTALYNSGSGNTYQTAFDTKPWASFDFGATSIRWLTVAAGTGVYASSNLGLTWVTIATDRTANYQYFERSKNVLIATSDSYDTPLAWPGSSGTFMVRVNSNAPLCKYSINFQGFLILLNSQARKRGFFYQDENTQLTGTWASSFDIPSSQDDEITSTFILGKNMYVSTRYFLYRVSYVGGNPDFAFEKSKDWGYVGRTVKQIYVEGVGMIVAGLCWDGKTRLFDGSEDQIFSNNVEQDNGLCDFSLDNLSFAGSGPVVSFAETDFNENVYKLCVSIGAGSTQTTHIINYDGRSKAFYPFDRQHFNTMVMAESANKRFLMAFDRSGYCHMLNSGNLDGNTTPINDHYDSNLIFEKSPAQSQKGHQTNLFFSNTTSGRLYFLDRTNFGNEYKLRETFVISGSNKTFQVHQVIDTPESYNTYQWRLTSSSGTSDPWKLQRYDHMLKGQGIGRED